MFINRPESVEVVTRREFSGVRELAFFPTGLRMDQINYKIDTDETVSGLTDNLFLPAVERTRTMRPSDFNGPKAALRSLSATDSGININCGITDYFTLWGLPGALPDVFDRAKREMTETGKTEIPLGISTHNIVITEDMKVLARVSSRAAGFSAGRVSLSYEEQMEPGADLSVVNVPYRGIMEEVGLIVPSEDTYLLGVGLEKNSAYFAFCFAQMVGMESNEIDAKLSKSQDRAETSGVLWVPLDQIQSYKGPVGPETWLKHVSPNIHIPGEATFDTHATVNWRVDLLQRFIDSIN